jgi:hypothetical protein
LADLSGRNMQAQQTTIGKGNQKETINLKSIPAKGMYMVKVFDEAKQLVFTEKIMIQ